MPLALLVAVPLLSIAYAYALVYSPIAGWISFLLVAAFGAALGWSVGKLGYLARCRSPRYLLQMGFAAGLLGLYVSWACFEYALLRQSSEAELAVGPVDFLLSPALLWSIASDINASGWYSIKGTTPSGGFLWVLWGIEALTIVGISTLVAKSAIDDHVFCESCERWCETAGNGLLATPSDAAELAVVRSGNLGRIEALPVAGSNEPLHLALDVRRCSRCGETGAFRIRQVTTTFDKKGKAEKRSELLLDYAQRPRVDLERLIAVTQRP